ncbi:hypothetical protein M501DRAFT_282254 [Patellaria atrata CBS 101060]|uniref:Uncharacterized protein n=1 Tax=Patellaria atrata CBS 101060 TaxID=1346257 RepID=A0A9P4S4L5_9PEZI|nr:hypothetical protein M501DRAFT_282254 [Patellaria atrata CBS 101060]
MTGMNPLQCARCATMSPLGTISIGSSTISLERSYKLRDEYSVPRASQTEECNNQRPQAPPCPVTKIHDQNSPKSPGLSIDRPRARAASHLLSSRKIRAGDGIHGLQLSQGGLGTWSSILPFPPREKMSVNHFGFAAPHSLVLVRRAAAAEGFRLGVYQPYIYHLARKETVKELWYQLV